MFQEVALRFCQKAGELNNGQYLLPWFQTVLLHCHYSEFRKRNMNREIPLSHLSEPRPKYDEDDAETYVLPDGNLGMEAIKTEFSLLLEALNPLEKMIVELSVVGGLSVRELGRLFGLSKASIVNRRLVAFQKMEKKMMEQKENFKMILGRDATLREIIGCAG